MKRFLTMFIMIVGLAFFLSACQKTTSEAKKEAASVNAQQAQYAIGQPVPKFDWSLERHLMIELYKLRNQKVSTYAIWRSDYGMIEGDCPSLGYGLPYDVSLTNPLVSTGSTVHSITSIEQAEPNGIFASKNTSATWVMCLNKTGGIEPVYVESKVTIYPGPMNVDYEKNRVTRSGAATVIIPQN